MRLRQLAMQLSKLEACESRNLELEQYPTSGELAARWMFDIAAFGDLWEGCSVADLGSGNGILGIGALHLGASRAIMIDSDAECCEVSRRNIRTISDSKLCDVLESDIASQELNIGPVDLVISNPPWGRQKEGADAPFLDFIESIGAVSHLMHSANSKHIRPRFEKAGWHVEMYGEADFAIPAAFDHHRSSRGATRAGFWRLTPP